MDSGSLAGKTPSIVAKALPDDRSTIARRHSYRPSTQAASSRPRPAFIERHRGFINAYRLTSQPGEGGITFYTPAGRTQQINRMDSGSLAGKTRLTCLGCFGGLGSPPTCLGRG